MQRSVWKGKVEKIETLDKYLTMVTLSSLDGSFVEARIPFYAKIPKEYIGESVEIVSERLGFFGRTFEQNVKSSSCMNFGITMPYSFVKDVRNAYRRF